MPGKNRMKDRRLINPIEAGLQAIQSSFSRRHTKSWDIFKNFGVFRLRAHHGLILLAGLALMPATGRSQALAPRIFYSDLQSGPNVGGQNDLGAFVTIYGNRFGVGGSTSAVIVGGGAVANYLVWTNTQITFQLGSSAATGNIVVQTPEGASNGVPFTVAPGNIYFVATTGNDNDDGSYASPWATLLQSRDMMQPGDITYAMNGVSQTGDDGQGWNSAFTLQPAWSAASGNPRALVAYPGAVVTIGSVNGPDSGIRSTQYGGWVFAGLQLRGTYNAASLWGSNWRFVNNDMTCPNGDGEDACFHTSEGSNIELLGNNVHDTGTSSASAEYHAVYFSTDSNQIEAGWNTIARVHGCRGLQVYSTALDSNSGFNQYDITIHDNVIHDTQCDGIVLGTVDPSKGPVQVYNNLIYNAGTGPNNPEQTGNWSCVFVAGYTNTGAAGGGTVDVYGNTMYNCGSFATPPYGNSTGGVMNGGNNSALYIRIRNNIIYQLNSNAPYWANYSSASNGVYGSNNLFFGIGAAPSSTEVTNSVESDPLFANLSQHDFHLTSSSPAKNAGVTTPQITDYDGVPLPQGPAYPIGAYAYVTGGFTLQPGSLQQISVGADGAVWGLNGGQIYEFDTNLQSWVHIPGFLTRIAVGSNGDVWGLNGPNIYRFNSTAQEWIPEPGYLTQIAVGSDGDVWGLNGANVYHFNSAIQTWSLVPGSLAQIQVGFDGAVWGLNAAGSIYRFNPGSQSFEQIPGWLSQISVGSDGAVWGINGAGGIYRFNPISQSFEPVSGELKQIVVGSGANVWGINSAGLVYSFDQASQTWTHVAGTLARLAVGANGAVWGVDANDAIYRFIQPLTPAGEFQWVPGATLVQIAAGAGGDVWGLDPSGNAFGYNIAAQTWSRLGSNFGKIAVGFGGNAWGIDLEGRIYRFEAARQSWMQVPGLLAQITVGVNADVWGVNPGDFIYSYNPQNQNWTQVPGLLVQLSIGSDGAVWGLNAGGQIYRFDPQTKNWDSIPGSLAQIAIGSKQAVWGVNSAGLIYQYNTQTASWSNVPGSLSHIAVGFDGAVWGINAGDEIYRWTASDSVVGTDAGVWNQIPGALSQISVGASAVVWGVNSAGDVYRFQ